MKLFLVVALFAAAAVAAYVLYSCARIAYTVQASKNPSIVQQSATFGSGSETLRYVAAGDSTAVGEGASGVQHTYPYKLAAHVALTNTVEYTDVAVDGATTGDLIRTQLPQIIALNPDVVTISIGANDRTHLASNSAIYGNIQSVIQQLLAHTHATLYVADIPNFYNQTLLPLPYVWLLEHETSSLNPELLALAGDRVKIIDVHNFGWENYPDIRVTISSDQFHPNDVGYQNWTNAFLSKMP